MSNFNIIQNIKSISDFYSNLKQPLADLNPMMMLVWSKSLFLSYKIHNESLFVIGYFENIPYLWGPPIGSCVTINHIRYGIDIIKTLRINDGIKTNEPEILYLWEEYKLFKELQANEKYSIIMQANEYIYETETLAKLNHASLKVKRKSKQRFQKKFSPIVKQYNSIYITQILNLIDKWARQKEKKILHDYRNKFHTELKVCKNAINMDLPFEGVVAFIDGEIVGFSLGYKHSNDMFNCMFEKTDLSFPEASVYIFSELGQILINK